MGGSVTETDGERDGRKSTQEEPEEETEDSPEDEMSFQLMAGSGLPLAWHIRVTLEPSFTTISLDRLMIFGGTVREGNIKLILFSYS